MEIKLNTLLAEILVGIIAEIIVIFLSQYNLFIIVIVGVVLAIILVFRTSNNEIFLVNRIISSLKKYEKHRKNPEKEKKIVRKFGQLLDKNHKKLEKIGFGIEHNGDTIKDEFYGIHLTRKTTLIHQFLVRRLSNGENLNPDQAFFSEGYSSHDEQKQNTQILTDFKEYLKGKNPLFKFGKSIKRRLDVKKWFNRIKKG